LQEKESELASISAEKNRLVDEELERLQAQEQKHNEEISKLRGQLKQLTSDFKYNLQLLKDRDSELELLENQITAHKETASLRAQVWD
jgi:chromosome segregation ATPase